MFNNVIVGIDGRQGGRDAVALARALAQPGATMTLASVYGLTYVPSYGASPGRAREDRDAAEQLLSAEAARLQEPVRTVVKESPSTARGLHELAEQDGADLLVLGSSHRGILGRATLGDDTRAGINGAPCAVAVATCGYAEDASPLATIGVAYDDGPESRIALACARELAARTGARVSALNIVTAPTYLYSGMMPPVGTGIDELVKAAEAKMRGLEGVEAHARYGAIDVDLAEFSKHVDLLAVGSRGYGPARRLIEGSTCRYLLRHSRAPLLVLPRGVSTPPAGSAADGAGSREPAAV